MTDPIEMLARKYGFSRGAVEVVMRALLATNGRSAQFNHVELGGFGQWMPGMIQIGDMFNTALQGRVSALCVDVVAYLSEATDEPTRGVAPPYARWWPADLGAPTAQGGAGDLRYAYFAAHHLLLVGRGDALTRYDTRGHRVSGFQQAGAGGSTTLLVTTEDGVIALDHLPIVS
jgi:hypothetical protein